MYTESMCLERAGVMVGVGESVIVCGGEGEGGEGGGQRMRMNHKKTPHNCFTNKWSQLYNKYKIHMLCPLGA